jgi:hypothetical protein
MQVQFESRAAEASQLRDLTIDRLQFSMRRLTWLVPRARVLLSDVNGPRGGVDKCRQLEIKTLSAGTLVITSVARDWRSALDTSLARASQALIRIWRRNQRRDRPRQRDLHPDH